MQADSVKTNMINQNEVAAEEEETEIDLIELFYFYRSRIVFILIAFLVGSILAGALTYFVITPKYTAQTKIYMVSPTSGSVVDLSDLNIGTSLSSDYQEMLKIRPMLEKVIDKLKLNYTTDELFDMIEVETVTDTRILTVSVTSTVPKEAMDIANALADEAVTMLPKIMDTPVPNIAEEAILPQAKSSPSLVKNTAIGGIAVMAIVLIVLTFGFVTDDTIKTDEDVEKVFGVMPLTSIPEGDMGSNSDMEYK
ncbi:MAG: capsular polysaccharide biosynthesis protein [Eubacterium sp.]|nr:capsular polysaccharide biosynthesis protein [Eubacterium sp.]